MSFNRFIPLSGMFSYARLKHVSLFFISFLSCVSVFLSSNLINEEAKFYACYL